MNSHRHLVVPVLLASLALLAGCTGMSRHMRPAPAGTVYRPESNQSLVIFMRPSPEDRQFQSSVFEITPTEDKLVGIVSAQTKVAYITTPGEHTFLLIGRYADFMKARLEAGKTYYALVKPEAGSLKTRFAFAPVKGYDLRSDTFKKWVEGCTYVENTPSAYSWAKASTSSIQSKKRTFLPEWEKKPDAEKPALAPEDGM
jgi:hypothetical protein